MEQAYFNFMAAVTICHDFGTQENKVCHYFHCGLSLLWAGAALLLTSLVAQLVKNPPAMQETPVRFLGWEDPRRRDTLATPVFLGFPDGSAGKDSSCNAEDLGSTPR